MEQSRSGQILDIEQRRCYPGKITIKDNVIAKIEELAEAPQDFLAPGFIDAHIHIESSMLTPSRFSQLAVCHGTIGTVSDPHEIANVLGEAGVEFMIQNASQVPLKIHYGAPSCVPATNFESAGATIDSKGVQRLLERDDIFYLSEMMNFPGVIYSDPEVLAKIEHAKAVGKVIDGHAPGVRGENLRVYASAGISTDHECFTLEEALEKRELGMKIIIREGSAAKSFNTLIPLMKDHAAHLMFCSDDRHPDDLRDGHINDLVRRALEAGYDLYDVWRTASINPIEHYGLRAGCLRVGDPADFLVLADLHSVTVSETIIDGVCVAKEGVCQFDVASSDTPNIMSCPKIQKEALAVEHKGTHIRVIDIVPGQLVTKEFIVELGADSSLDRLAEKGIHKLLVYNRYTEAKAAVAYVRGFDLSNGALGSTIAHDSHNIIAVGCSDDALVQAVNALIDVEGGICLVDGDTVESLPLPVAGLMSDDDGLLVAEQYESMSLKTKSLGASLPAPYMSLSFLALLVIPELKLSDKGLFNGNSFEFTPLFFTPEG